MDNPDRDKRIALQSSLLKLLVEYDEAVRHKEALELQIAALKVRQEKKRRP